MADSVGLMMPSSLSETNGAQTIPSSYDVINVLVNGMFGSSTSTWTRTIPENIFLSGKYRTFMFHLYNLNWPSLSELGSYKSNSGSASIRSANGLYTITFLNASRSTNSASASISSNTTLYNAMCTSIGIFIPVEYGNLTTTGSYWYAKGNLDLIGVK